MKRQAAGDISMKLKGQTAIVTGAGRNIGEEVAKLLASEGAAVAIVDLDGARAQKVAGEIVAGGGQAKAFVCDVGKAEDIEALVRDVVAGLGRVDILVNNAAISDNKNMLDVTLEEWNRVLAITLTAPFLLGRTAAKQMIAQGGGGRIVNVGSTSGYYGRPRAVAYTAAKGGVANLTRSMAVQLAPYNIRVNSVVPNKIGSPVGKDAFDPNRPVVNLRNRPGLPIDLARAILFLVSDDSDFIAGASLFVDGGCSVLMPGSE
jgi:NAD(P)-dependent dehydrogenase (short-subunit alcohol dehydrogenase family)